MGSGLRQEEALASPSRATARSSSSATPRSTPTPPAPDLPPTFASPATTATAAWTPASARAAGSAATSTASPTRWRSSPTARSCWRATSSSSCRTAVFVSDFVVARFNANGSLDLPFGTSGTGQVATDIGGATNSGAQPGAATQRRDRRQRHAAVQPAGVRSTPTSFATTPTARSMRASAMAASSRWPTWTSAKGWCGRPTASWCWWARSCSRSLPATARFVLMRRNADGSPDTGFGSAGTASTRARARTPLPPASRCRPTASSWWSARARSRRTRTSSSRATTATARSTPASATPAALSIDFFGFNDIGENVLVQPDGRIVVGGQARNNVDGYGVARINP